MTVSETTLRTLAGLAQGRNAVLGWAAGIDPPDHRLSVVPGVSLADTTLSMMTIVSGWRPSGLSLTTDYAVIEGAIDAPGSTYSVDYDGTSVAYVVQVGDEVDDIADGLKAAYDAAGISATYADGYAVKYAKVGGNYSGIRTVRANATAAPTATSGGNLTMRTSSTASSSVVVWLLQRFEDGSSAWIVPSGGGLTLSVNGSISERLSSASYEAIYIQVPDPTVSLGYVEAWAAPCTPEVA
jgi:hypothetical protein